MNTDIWDSFFGDINGFNQRIENMFSEFNNPNVRTYGYTTYCGPDGVPHKHEFGNMATPSIPNGAREPLIDVSKDGDIVRVVVELPGVKKEDIRLESSDGTLSVSVDTESKKFSKDLALPCKILPDSAHAEYNNGILEVTLNAEKSASNKKTISIA